MISADDLFVLLSGLPAALRGPVLAVQVGNGYAAAALAMQGHRVVAVETHDGLRAEAQQRLQALGFASSVSWADASADLRSGESTSGCAGALVLGTWTGSIASLVSWLPTLPWVVGALAGDGMPPRLVSWRGEQGPGQALLGEVLAVPPLLGWPSLAVG